MAHSAAWPDRFSTDSRRSCVAGARRVGDSRDSNGSHAVAAAASAHTSNVRANRAPSGTATASSGRDAPACTARATAAALASDSTRQSSVS